MEPTVAHLSNTNLRDRTLWFDGQSSFKSSDVLTAIDRYDIRFVDKLTPEIIEYNHNVKKHQEIKVKTECGPLSRRWDIPTAYANLDIVNYVFNVHDIMVAGMPTAEIDARERRLTLELLALEKRNLNDVVRALIYTINTLTNNNVVWGVGRGSSVSSYVMYVIGVHDVDSYEYDLSIDDFLHD
jgi:DNA polymerase III alpha subunit